MLKLLAISPDCIKIAIDGAADIFVAVDVEVSRAFVCWVVLVVVVVNGG